MGGVFSSEKAHGETSRSLLRWTGRWNPVQPAMTSATISAMEKSVAMVYMKLAYEQIIPFAARVYSFRSL